jgi:hypothetical protein
VGREGRNRRWGRGRRGDGGRGAGTGERRGGEGGVVEQDILKSEKELLLYFARA